MFGPFWPFYIDSGINFCLILVYKNFNEISILKILKTSKNTLPSSVQYSPRIGVTLNLSLLLHYWYNSNYKTCDNYVRIIWIYSSVIKVFHRVWSTNLIAVKSNQYSFLLFLTHFFVRTKRWKNESYISQVL